MVYEISRSVTLKKIVHKFFVLLERGHAVTLLYIYYFCGVEFLYGGKWKQHFLVLFSGKIAQFMNLLELLIFPIKRRGRVSRHPARDM